MDSTCPILPAELEFFNKGTGKGNLSRGTTPINNLNTSTVPLVVVFTKFDAQIIQESGKLDDMDDAVKWDKARENAETTFQTVISLKSLTPSILQKHMCAWEVGIINIAISQRYR
jgi:hypothetical protein